MRSAISESVSVKKKRAELKFFYEKWEYNIGNNVATVENAETITGWTQERLSVNGEVVETAGRWFGLRRVFEGSWIISIDEKPLRIELNSTLQGIICKAYLGSCELFPTSHMSSKWSGKKFQWPPSSACA